MKELVFVAGARPNFMKIAPILRTLRGYGGIRTTLVHTGQHYDQNLSQVFFDELKLPKPDIHLNVGSGRQGEQTARIIERFEAVLEKGPTTGGAFDRLVVVGDVNSTMAATLAAAKLGVPVAHIEAGLRSFDRTMPEEINRIVTDALADCLLVSESAGLENLRREGHTEDHLYLVGNVMIDTLLEHLPLAQERHPLTSFGIRRNQYGVVTLHRPSNVDSPGALGPIVEALVEISHELPLVFPIHPRTKDRLASFNLAGLLQSAEGVKQLLPLGYLPFLSVSSQARFIITDSGGLQEESTALGIPCLTLRANTERPITVEEGTSTLVGNDTHRLRYLVRQVLNGSYKSGRCPALWDGLAAQRIAAVLAES